MINKTAVLLFSNTSQVDSSRKKILGGQKLFDELNQKVVQKLKKSQLPYFIITEKYQRGKNFGERYYYALKDVFDKGFNNVISIGNDTPQLKVSHLLEAQTSLFKNETVIGPSLDGGFYLLGIDKNTFDQLDFKDLSWQSPRLFSQIVSALKSIDQSLSCLSRLADVDGIADLKYFQNLFKQLSKAIQSLISIILQKFKAVFLGINFIISGIDAHIPYNKGSPDIV